MKRTKWIAFFMAVLLILPLFSSISAEAYEVRALHMYAHSYAVMDANSGKILFGENVNKKIYPASTAKLMSAIVAVESDMDLDTVIEAKSKIVNHTTLGTYSLGMKGGDHYTLSTLLNMSLIASAADATDMMANAIAGSRDAFAEMMMDKVKELGLTKTSFDNPVGSDIGGGFDYTYSTAKEMCEITRYAMTLPAIRKIVAKKSFTIHGGSLDGRTIRNTNWFYTQYPYNDDMFTIIGSKTGQTTAAGDVFVATAIDDEGHELICAYFGKGGKEETFRWIDNLLTYAFKEYKKGNLTLTKGAYNIRYHEDSEAYIRGINGGGIPTHSNQVDFDEVLTEKQAVKLIKASLNPELKGTDITSHFDETEGTDSSCSKEFFTTALKTALPGIQNITGVRNLLMDLSDEVTVADAAHIMACAIHRFPLYKASIPSFKIVEWTPENPMPFATTLTLRIE